MVEQYGHDDKTQGRQATPPQGGNHQAKSVAHQTSLDVHHRDDEGKLCGDVDFAGVSQVAGYITPVPGGVGPMTITMLLVNTLEAAERL